MPCLVERSHAVMTLRTLVKGTPKTTRVGFVMRTFRRSIVALSLASLSFLIVVPSSYGAAQPQQLQATAISAAGDTPATALRLLLGRLLGEHSFLLMEAIRAETLDQPESAAIRAGLDDNSRELAEAIASDYGAAGGAAFDELWQRHITLLIEHAAAQRDGDAAAASEALAGLTQFRHEFATFLAGANPMIEGHAEADAVQLHLDQVIAFSEGDYDKAYAAEREAFRHMFAFGDHLAQAIGMQFPDKYTGALVAWSPAATLRLALGRLLGEHLVLSAEAMRALLSQGPDANAAQAALDANSAELAQAIGTYYGDEAEAAFRRVWDKHVEAYLEFIDSYVTDDAAARSEALMTLHDYHDEIAAFLADANPHLTREAVSGLIRRHVQSLIAQVEATTAGDHTRAVATVRSAYDFMFEVGDALAAAIALQFPDQFVEIKELPPTDGTARSQSRDWIVVLLVALIGGLSLVPLAPYLGARRQGVHRPSRR